MGHMFRDDKPVRNPKHRTISAKLATMSPPWRSSILPLPSKWQLLTDAAQLVDHATTCRFILTMALLNRLLYALDG